MIRRPAALASSRAWTVSAIVLSSLAVVGLLFLTTRPARPSTTQPDDVLLRGRDLVHAYDPIVQAEAYQRALNHTCTTLLPTAEQVRSLNQKHGWTLSRLVSYFNVHTYLTAAWSSRPPSAPKLQVLDLGGSSFLRPFEDHLNITLTSYPGTDAHRLDFPPASFDVVAADQVIEHVLFPHVVMLEIRKVLKPGGIAIVTSCAYNPVHEGGGFHDLWRFQVDGLRALAVPFEGGVEVCGAWGTERVVATRVEKGLGSDAEREVFERDLVDQATRNSPDNPFTVWMVVRR